VPFLQVPSGFRATQYQGGLNGPRFLTVAPDGTVYVAERTSGDILALSDPGHSGVATRKTVVASGLYDPTSVVVSNGALYVGQRSQVTHLALGPDLRTTDKQVVVAGLPTSGQHTTRTVLIGPDSKIYVAIGSTCDVCIESDPRRAAVWVYNHDGSAGRLYAKGLRNAVGLATNPWNGQIWATNNGRDYLGDESPPETVYRLQDGGDYGWPRCHAGDIVDPAYGYRGACNGVVAPLVKMQAHSAPLGLAFYQSGAFPARFHGLFVAFHGSWNRTVKTGYKVIFVPLDARGAVAGGPQDFATGWLRDDGSEAGRPVGLAVGPDGALYVSDDAAGAVYRIAFVG
jgi:glucose/arabinose dehydrogenase